MTLFQTHRQHGRDVFAAVFPVQNHSVPTPQITPEIGVLHSSGQTFGGFHQSNDVVEETLIANRAWSAVTNWLRRRLKNGSILLDKHEQAAWQQLLQNRSSDIHALTEWYAHEVADHFALVEKLYRDLTSAWPRALNDSEAASMAWDLLVTLSDHASRACDLDDHRLDYSTRQALQALAIAGKERWIASVIGLDFRAQLEQALAMAFFAAFQESTKQNDSADCLADGDCQCRVDLNDVPFEQLIAAGMGGRFAQTSLAIAAYHFLTEPALDRQCFRVDWQRQMSAAQKLSNWIKNKFEPLMNSASLILANTTQHDSAQNESVVEMAIRSLGRKRSDALFAYIKSWPHSRGAIDDLLFYLAPDHPGDKMYTCESCQVQIQQRLLHAGTSTSEVLGFYVNLVNVFRYLDSRGVLLEKVSAGIRQYLRSRNDTVNVIAESLLADTGSTQGKESITICQPLVQDLEHATHGSAHVARTLDWDDMNWLPDPIDALASYRSTRTDDILSYVLSLFEQEDFIKEIETVLAEHLLRSTDAEIVKETRLLELLKSRLDASKLQNAEVMLKDIRDSVIFERRFRADSSPIVKVPDPKEIQAAIPSEGITITELYTKFEHRIKRTQFQAILKLVATRRSNLLFPKRGRLPSEPSDIDLQPYEEPSNVQLRILSSSCWPQMQENQFALPTEFADQLQHFEEKFSSISGQRKLRWRPALGRMSVTLDLEDRTIEERDLPAWRAMVVNAFAGEDQGLLTVEQLKTSLSMDEELVQEALAYWLGKRVLYQQTPGHYAVLERLDMNTGDQEVASAPVEEFSGLKSQDTVLRENAGMFEAFIAGLLQNGGPKEVGGMMGITNMMKMVLPTFTYGDEEVKWLLISMASKGQVVKDGETWSSAG